MWEHSWLSTFWWVSKPSHAWRPGTEYQQFPSEHWSFSHHNMQVFPENSAVFHVANMDKKTAL